MNTRYFFAVLCLLPLHAMASGLSVDGALYPAVEVAADAQSGLDGVIVFEPGAGKTELLYRSASPNSSKWYTYGNQGAAYAEQVNPQVSGTECRLALGSEDTGIIIEDGGKRQAYWIVNYANHRLELKSLEPAAEQDCDRTLLNFGGTAEEIPYYSLTARRMVLSRELAVSYNTLVFNQDSYTYASAETTETLAGIGGIVSVPAPLCNTSFTLSGDRFLRAWGMEESVESGNFDTHAVGAQCRATQLQREVDNEIRDNTEGLGGSAPCEVTFEAAVTDAAIFTEWQISRSPDFGILENSYSETEFTYTFRDQGTTYVRFTANNAEGTCPFESETFTVFVGESKLEIPNAFSPEASPGVNDEWKVSYKSLIRYECHIFNRLGQQLFSSTDPAEGWDGKYRGKYVPSGVYFYVIKAEGADGVKYERAGDINIIKYTEGNTSDSQE